MTKLLIQIPFSGFYNSLHDWIIDDHIDRLTQDENGDPTEFEIDFSYTNSFLNGYCKLYTEALNQELDCKFDLEFESMNSPQYYNYSTDRIFAEITLENARKLFDLTNKDLLKENIKKAFTSRDGFISHYSNNLDQWPDDLANWDHNNLYILLKTYIDQELDQDYENYLMDDASGNGHIDNLIYDTLNSDQLEILEKFSNVYFCDI